jgi:ElaB/YqjD/DUF883 family membrane-anchored ribosome-binding protein
MNAAVVELFDGVDDLIRRVADTECPETRKIRARVHAALVAARNALGKAAPAPSQIPVEPPAAPDDKTLTFYEIATQTLGVALLLGVGLGLMVDS